MTTGDYGVSGGLTAINLAAALTHGVMVRMILLVQQRDHISSSQSPRLEYNGFFCMLNNIDVID